MELDSFLIEKRWEILRILAETPSSPIEIAEKLHTTVSYVSQQLKLLEAVGLVKKERTGAVEKGKPRSVYSITNEVAYVSLLTHSNSGKKLIYLTPHHKQVLNIWLLEDITLHYPIEKFFWELENFLGEIDGVFFEQGPNPRVLVLTGSKTIKTKVDSLAKKLDKRIGCSVFNKDSLSHLPLDSVLPLYDPTNILQELKSGGELK